MEHKPRILIVQSAGEHLENREFRESLCIKRALDLIGVPNTVWGKGYPTFAIPFPKISKDFDILLIVENYDFSWIPDLKEFKGAKIMWSIDSHLVFDKHAEFVTAQEIKLVLDSNVMMTPKWTERKIDSVWFANCYDHLLIKPKLDIQKSHVIGFCGSRGHQERDAQLDEITEQMKARSIELKQDILVIGDNMVNAVNSYMIHWNMNIANDINYRTFETCGCQTALLTNYTNGLDMLFDVENEVITWASPVELLQKAQRYCKDITECMRIAKNGYERALRDHTYEARMNNLIKFLYG